MSTFARSRGNGGALSRREVQRDGRTPPWDGATKHFTPEDLEVVEAGAAKIVADSDRRERRAKPPGHPRRAAGQASVPPVPGFRDARPRRLALPRCRLYLPL